MIVSIISYWHFSYLQYEIGFRSLIRVQYSKHPFGTCCWFCPLSKNWCNWIYFLNFKRHGSKKDWSKTVRNGCILKKAVTSGRRQTFYFVLLFSRIRFFLCVTFLPYNILLACDGIFYYCARLQNLDNQVKRNSGQGRWLFDRQTI